MESARLVDVKPEGKLPVRFEMADMENEAALHFRDDRNRAKQSRFGRKTILPRSNTGI